MNEREVAELRRRFKPDKNNINRIRGCYVNDKKEIISEFNQSLGLMSIEESEKLLVILKKTLSGSIGRNLVDIEFTNQQVLESEEHKLLMILKNSTLDDETAVKAFYNCIIQALNIEGNYIIILACDKYDVPSYTKDGNKNNDTSDVFTYFLCSICPVKLTKPALSYVAKESRFENLQLDWVVSAPELGFMFPAFDDRSSNIYNALYYTHSISENHIEFIDAVFKSNAPMPAAVQKEIFQNIMGDTVAEDCSFHVMQSVHEQISGIIEDHKENKEKEPLVINKDTVKSVLKSCGVSDEHMNAFEKKYDSEFGENTEINPSNIVNTKQFEVQTPNVTIRVNHERIDLVETRVIDGKKYILIRADETIEVYGVNRRIA